MMMKVVMLMLALAAPMISAEHNSDTPPPGLCDCDPCIQYVNEMKCCNPENQLEYFCKNNKAKCQPCCPDCEDAIDEFTLALNSLTDCGEECSCEDIPNGDQPLWHSFFDVCCPQFDCDDCRVDCLPCCTDGCTEDQCTSTRCQQFVRNCCPQDPPCCDEHPECEQCCDPRCDADVCDTAICWWYTNGTNNCCPAPPPTCEECVGLFNSISAQDHNDCDPPCWECDDLLTWSEFSDQFHNDSYQPCCGTERTNSCPAPPPCEHDACAYDSQCCHDYCYECCDPCLCDDAAAAVLSTGESTNSTVATLSWVLIAVAAALFLASIAFCAIGRRERKAFIASSEQSQSAMA